MANNLTTKDELFIKTLMSDVIKELCECECNCKEKECSMFERLFIAQNIMGKNIIKDGYVVYSDAEHTTQQNVFDSAGNQYTLYENTPSSALYKTLTVNSNTYDEDGSLIASLYDSNGDSVTTLYGTFEKFDFNGLEGSDSCIDWNTLSERINNNYEAKNKFYDASRKKILSRFYYMIHKYLWGRNNVPSTNENYNVNSWNLYGNTDTTKSLGEYLLGENVSYVMSNCLDECCN